MEPRPEGPQSPFEVYCYDCRTTFPVGTRQCVHCGGRLGDRKRSRIPALPHPLESLEVEENEAPEPRFGRKLGGLSLWVLLAVGAVISRLCAGS